MCAYLKGTPTPVFRQAKKMVVHVLTVSLFDLNLPPLPSYQHSPSTFTLCPQLKPLASTSVRVNTWNVLRQSVCTHAPTMSSLCGCTLPLSFQNYTVSPVIPASHGHFTLMTACTVHCISSYTLYLVWLSQTVNLLTKDTLGIVYKFS